jgi:hypothetical protein
MKPYRGVAREREQTFSSVVEWSIHRPIYINIAMGDVCESLFAIRASWGGACVLTLETLAQCKTEKKRRISLNAKHIVH